VTIVDTLTVRIEADTADFDRELEQLNASLAQANGSLAAALGEIQPATRAAARAADDLGSALANAFNGAIVRGKSLGDVLRNLAVELARVAVRETTRRTTTSLLGNIFSALPFGGGLAEGGPVAPGVPYLVGERGPELFVPDMAGAVMPNGALAGGDVRVTYNIDARGADLGVEARIRAAMRETEARTLAAVQALADRGGGFSKAVGRR
jgi:hypothetical protein